MTRMILLIVMLLLSAGAATTSAAEYRVGPEDVLQIKFWQEPTLNSQVRVNQEGKIVLDIIGEVEAAGLRIQDLQMEIVNRMSRLNRLISQATVQVTEFNYQHVFVYGQVSNPGKKTFEEIPDLLAILNEAGWITATGDLSRVSIIHGGERAGQVEVVDVAGAMANGTVDQLPKLLRTDAIDVPSMPVGIPPPDLGRLTARKNVIYVLGAVNTPGPIRFEENIDVMEALALAGGHTGEADLRRAQIVSKDGYYGQTMQIDLEKYATTGTPARHLMHKEDVCVVPFRKQGFMGRNLGTIVTILGAATSAVLLYENLKPEPTQ
ncbi:MAG: polysaccharide biosynthesis/export family protein [candidate division Zixibacteria bacterium]|nr:polysaccharide biosynthesis/export family protein [candidate division Zixibacteria bacterium]MDH3937892.1 polysaccharide biosynthesis/export family protein [candidate division Zixibacteria bacterium]MDH4035194.1 polysaccharide biosynthesis/export family protein [candidate division Zixibacteria bacterium]